MSHPVTTNHNENSVSPQGFFQRPLDRENGCCNGNKISKEKQSVAEKQAIIQMWKKQAGIKIQPETTRTATKRRPW